MSDVLCELLADFYRGDYVIEPVRKEIERLRAENKSLEDWRRVMRAEIEGQCIVEKKLRAENEAANAQMRNLGTQLANVGRQRDALLAAAQATDALWSADAALGFEAEMSFGSPVGNVWKLVRDAIRLVEGNNG